MVAEPELDMADVRAPLQGAAFAKASRSATQQLEEQLARRYSAPQYAFIKGVSDATGFNRWRRADAIAMSIWPSRGLELHGFELKVSRYDWLRELKDPSKAEGIFAYCDRWWLVTNDPKIAQTSEIPSPWGWLCAYGNRWRVLKDAPQLKPKPMSRVFLAALLRHVNDDPAITLAEAERKGYERGKEMGEQIGRSTIKRQDEIIRGFEQKSGIKLDAWGYGDIGAAVKRFIEQEGRAEGVHRSVKYLRNNLTALVRDIDQVIAEVESNGNERTDRA